MPIGERAAGAVRAQVVAQPARLRIVQAAPADPPAVAVEDHHVPRTQLVAVVEATRRPATGGEVTLFVNDEPVGGGRMEHTVPVRFSGYAGLDIGRDNGMPVDRSYADKSPFAFTGTVKKVVFDVNPHVTGAHEEELHEHLHQALAGHAINA